MVIVGAWQSLRRRLGTTLRRPSRQNTLAVVSVLILYAHTFQCGRSLHIPNAGGGDIALPGMISLDHDELDAPFTELARDSDKQAEN